MNDEKKKSLIERIGDLIFVLIIAIIFYIGYVYDLIKEKYDNMSIVNLISLIIKILIFVPLGMFLTYKLLNVQVVI